MLWTNDRRREIFVKKITFSLPSQKSRDCFIFFFSSFHNQVKHEIYDILFFLTELVSLLNNRNCNSHKKSSRSRSDSLTKSMCCVNFPLIFEALWESDKMILTIFIHVRNRNDIFCTRRTQSQMCCCRITNDLVNVRSFRDDLLNQTALNNIG